MSQQISTNIKFIDSSKKSNENKKIIHKCVKCNKIFPSIYKLHRHMNRKYPCDRESNQCEFCGNYFYDVSTKNRHIKNTCTENPDNSDSD